MQGVPPDLRHQVWLELSGAAQRRRRHPPHYYASAALQGADSPYAHQIELVGGWAGGWVGMQDTCACCHLACRWQPSRVFCAALKTKPAAPSIHVAVAAGRAPHLPQQRLGAERGRAERSAPRAAGVCPPQPTRWLVRLPAAAAACCVRVCCRRFRRQLSMPAHTGALHLGCACLVFIALPVPFSAVLVDLPCCLAPLLCPCPRCLPACLPNAAASR